VCVCRWVWSDPTITIYTYGEYVEMAGLKKKEKIRCAWTLFHRLLFWESNHCVLTYLLPHTGPSATLLTTRSRSYYHSNQPTNQSITQSVNQPINRSVNPLANHLNLRICDVSFYSYRHGIMQSSKNISYTHTLTRQGLWYPNLLQ
jgi:hypothetical protein